MSEYYMFNKPSGCVTARTDPRHKTVMDFFPEEKRNILFPVGRLDRDTEGLLIVTDDGVLCASLLSPDLHVRKTYFFYAVGTLKESDREMIEQGIKLYPTKDIVTKPAEVSVWGESTLGKIKELLSPFDLKKANRKPDTPVFFGTVTVTEGKKHQVKRMLLFGDCRIVYLKRVAMGSLKLDEALQKGEFRPITELELALLNTK